MTTKDEMDLSELFLEEEEELKEEMRKVEAFYNESKEHFDKVKNSKPKQVDFNVGNDNSDNLNKKALPFVHNQTANLTAIRNAKIGLINDKMKLKKERMNMIFKAKQLGVEESKNENFAEIAKEFMKFIKPEAAAGSDETTTVKIDTVDITHRISEIDNDDNALVNVLNPCVTVSTSGLIEYAFFEEDGDEVYMNYEMGSEIKELGILFDEAKGKYFDKDGNEIPIFDAE